jgi:type I restriction enzyme M protein
VQHIATLLKILGRAAVVVPDNVLFEGGAGEVVRRKLLHKCDIHTLLRQPTGIFYAQGVKANVLFFDKKPGREKPWTEKVWIYDLRTNIHLTLKTNTLHYEDLQDFILCYKPENRHQRQESERFRAFTYDEIMQRDKVAWTFLAEG